ncbi:unnamed protein product, partial [Tilletia controversa]
MFDGQEGSSTDQAAIARALAAAQLRARQAASDIQQQQQQGTLQAYAQARDKDVTHSEALQATSSSTSTNPNTSISSATGSTPAGPSSVSILPATATASTAGSTPAQTSASKRTRQASKPGDATKQPAQKQTRVEPQAARTGPTDAQQSSSTASTSQSTSTPARSSTPPPNPSIKALIDAFTQFSPNSRSNLIASLANMDKVPGDDTSIQSGLEQERQQSGNPPTLGSSRVEAGSSSQSSAHPHPPGATTTSHERGAPPHASQHAPSLPRLSSQPPVIQRPVGYSKSAILDNFILLPSPAVVTKMTSSQLVPLWHFTKEGIAAGFTKYSSQTDTSKRLLENLGADIPLAKERMDDEQLNYEQFSRATDNQIDILKDLAKAEVDPIKRQLLQEEADIWELAYLRCAKDDRAKRRWPMMA